MKGTKTGEMGNVGSESDGTRVSGSRSDGIDSEWARK